MDATESGTKETPGAFPIEKLVNQVIKEEIGRLMRRHRKKLVARIRERLLVYGVNFDDNGNGSLT